MAVALPRPHLARPYRVFWALVVVAVLASGSLSAALGAAEGPLTGLRVAASGLVLLAALAGAGRVLVATDPARGPGDGQARRQERGQLR